MDHHFEEQSTHNPEMYETIYPPMVEDGHVADDENESTIGYSSTNFQTNPFTP